MPERLAARLLTGPAAFLLAGIIDIAAFTATSLRNAALSRWRARRRH
jgi:hypothetical protein